MPIDILNEHLKKRLASALSRFAAAEDYGDLASWSLADLQTLALIVLLEQR